MKGTRPLMAARCATPAKSMTSCTLPVDSMAKPVLRQLMTSEWSPNMDMAWVPTVRDATCSTPGSRSPAMRCRTGIISISPCDEVKLVASAPVCSAPCTAAAAPASDCISMSCTVWPNRFFLPLADHTSVLPAIGEDGVMG